MIEGWEITNISSVCDLLNGYAFKSSDYVTDGGILNFRVTNINWDGTVNISNDVEYLPESFINEYEKYLLKENDILFVMVGATRGKFALIPKYVLPALMNQNMWRILPKSDRLDKHFLYYYLRSKLPILFEQNEDQARGFFKKSDFNALELFLPQLPEQHKITYVLSTVQNAIEQQEKLIRTTTELKKALMQKLFTEGTKGEKQKQTEIGLMPESWDLPELGKCLLKSQYGLSAKGAESGSIPILRMTNQKDGYISSENLQYVNITEKEKEKFKVDVDDIIFNRTNSYELVGRTSIFKLEEEYVFASYLIRIKTNANILLPDFLNVYFNSDETQNRLKSIATRGVSQSNISATRLATFKIPKPSIAEQKEFIGISNQFDSKLRFHQNKKQTLTNLFKTLLHELMTGERRVNELDFEQIKNT